MRTHTHAHRRRFTWWVAVALVAASAGCGPTAIGVAIASGGGGGGGGAPPLTVDAVERPPAGGAGPCNLIASLEIVVNRPNVTLLYTRNGGTEQPFTDVRTGAVEREPGAGERVVRSVLLGAGANTLVVVASAGEERVTRTLQLDRAVDPVVVDLEPPDVNGRAMTLRWSLPAGSETFFWLCFDDQLGELDALRGTAAEGASPLRIATGQLQPTIVGGRAHYTFRLTELTEAPGQLQQQHWFGVRANDGCESRVVTAHTRPRAQRLSWPAVGRTTLDLVTPGSATPPNQAAQPPVGGQASLQSVVGMPPLFVDRGADASSAPIVVSPADGLDDLALVDRTGTVFVARNNGGSFAAPIVVDDTLATSPACQPPPVVPPPGPTGAILRSFTFDNDGDQRPDLFVLTADRLWVYAGDDAPEPLTASPTAGNSAYLNWKKWCVGFVELSSLAGVPAGSQFVDGWYGDFDGDGTPDLIASVGKPQTTTQAGEAHKLYVWYGNRDLDGFVLWDWPSGAPMEIPLLTGFGDDAFFVTGDVDRDGRDDVVSLRHSSATAATYRMLLMRGRINSPLLVESAPVDPRTEGVRWDQTVLRDLDHDGVLDVLGLRSVDVGVGFVVKLVGYRTDLATASLAIDPPYLQSQALERTHSSVPFPPRQRGHLLVRDIDGDGLEEVLLRSILTGSEFDSSRVAVFRVPRDSTTGLQNWQVVNATPVQVDFLRAAGETPHVHFAAADIDFDGVDDFCAVHERAAPPQQAVTMYSEPLWTWERVTGSLAGGRFGLAGSLATGGGASLAKLVPIARPNDLVLGADPVLGVAVLSAKGDEGAANGAFEPVRRVPLQAPLGFAIRKLVVPDVPFATADLIVLGEDGTVATLAYSAVTDSYALVPGAQIPGALDVQAGYFDADCHVDCVVIDGQSRMHLLGTVDAVGNHNQGLAVVDSRQLPRAPELVLANSINFDTFSEVVVVLSPSGSEERQAQIWRVFRDSSPTAFSGKARFFDTLATVQSTSFPTRLVSIAAANFSGRHRNNLQTRKWLVGGTADGRVLVARNGEGAALPLPGPGAAVGSGEVLVLAADVTNDNLPDLVAYERGSRRLLVFRNRPDADTAWRFPNSGAYQFQGSGEFDTGIPVPVPEPLRSIATGRVDNDVYTDLVLLSEQGERVHVIVAVGAQLPL